MGTEISLFSQKSFIEASEKFVCVRLGTYESLEHQTMIRGLLNGRMENTAFVVFAPDGKTKLSRSGRSPDHAFGKDVEGGMEKLADKYPDKARNKTAVLSDFHSFKQALNVASADQRLLVLTVASEKSKKSVNKKVQAVFSDEEMKGRFFYDTVNKGDEKWAENIKGTTKKSGIFIIRPGQFGQDGEVMKELSLKSSSAQIKKALTAANAEYAKTEKRTVSSEHVSEGTREGVDFENNVAQGEDRDGDGKIDPKPERGQRGGGRPPRR